MRLHLEGLEGGGCQETAAAAARNDRQEDNRLSTLQEKNVMLLSELGKTPHPGVRSVEMIGYLRDADKDQQITLYEYYLVAAERFSFERQAYLQPAWANKVYISPLLQILNMKMMALLFQEQAAAEMWDAWGMEAYRLNQEKRPHYILDNYPTFLRAERDPAVLSKLLAQRRSRKKPFDKGPYHDESFPWDRCVYEEMLLQGRYYGQEDRKISGEIEELLAELYLLQE